MSTVIIKHPTQPGMVVEIDAWGRHVAEPFPDPWQAPEHRTPAQQLEAAEGLRQFRAAEAQPLSYAARFPEPSEPAPSPELQAHLARMSFDKNGAVGQFTTPEGRPFGAGNGGY